MQIVSIKKEGNFLKICLLEKTFRKLSIKYLDTIDLSKREDLSKIDPLKRLEKFLDPKAKWVLSLPPKLAIEKVAEFPDLTWSKIKELIPYQIESLFPYDLHSFDLVQKKEKSKGIKNIIFRLVSKESVENAVHEINSINLEVHAMLFDTAAMKKLIFERNEPQETLFIHLNHHDTHIIQAEKKEIKSHNVLEKGYLNFVEEKKDFKDSLFLKELLWLLKLHSIDTSQKVILSGLFVSVENLSHAFLDYAFFSDDSETTRYAQEIAIAKLYLKSKKDVFSLDAIEQPKKKVAQEKTFKRCIQLFFLILGLFFSSSLWMQYQAKEKVVSFLDVGGLFKGQAFSSVLKAMKRFHEIDQPLLDLEKQPLGITRILTALEKPFLNCHCQLKEYHFELEKYPTFKAPSQPFKAKLSLSVLGEDKQIEKLALEIKKLSFVDKKKNCKIEKKKNESILEFSIL